MTNWHCDYVGRHGKLLEFQTYVEGDLQRLWIPATEVVEMRAILKVDDARIVQIVLRDKDETGHSMLTVPIELRADATELIDDFDDALRC